MPAIAFSTRVIKVEIIERLPVNGNSSRAGVWLIFGPMIGTRMSHGPPKMRLTP